MRAVTAVLVGAALVWPSLSDAQKLEQAGG